MAPTCWCSPYILYNFFFTLNVLEHFEISNIIFNQRVSFCFTCRLADKWLLSLSNQLTTTASHFGARKCLHSKHVFFITKKVFLQVWSHTLVPPVILLGSELNLMVMTGDCSRGGGGVGGRGDDGANSASRLTKSRDSFASLCNVAASSRDSFASLCNVDVSSDAKLGFECVNPWFVIIPPDVLSSSWKWHLNTVCTRNTLFFYL